MRRTPLTTAPRRQTSVSHCMCVCVCELTLSNVAGLCRCRRSCVFSRRSIPPPPDTAPISRRTRTHSARSDRPTHRPTHRPTRMPPPPPSSSACEMKLCTYSGASDRSPPKTMMMHLGTSPKAAMLSGGPKIAAGFRLPALLSASVVYRMICDLYNFRRYISFIICTRKSH